MQHRQGKINLGPHSTAIEGLRVFLAGIVGWPEISRIKVAEIVSARGARRGGLVFKAVGWVTAGGKTTGIRCRAKYGTSIQRVILFGPDLTGLKHRLEEEGLCAVW